MPYTVIPVDNNRTPCEGPKVVPVKITLSDNVANLVDLFSNINNSQISLIQSFFIDNADNAENLIIVCDVTGQRIICPANSQGYIPCLMPSPCRFYVSLESTPAQPVDVTIFACNFAVLPAFWTVTV
jgi:hypothetical protein